ncbi:MAG: glutamate 5-kinase [Maricaulis sp.]|jgi:glutamate 5-kinase|nr:glutamate 5-kinase [Maricaulis sp.]
MTRPAFTAARRIVIKAGSAIVDGQSPACAAIANDIAYLRATGVDVVLVSSGAIALGCPRLGINRDGETDRLSLEQKQAAAAAGQPALIQAWEQAFAAHNITTAQALITLDVTESRRRWLNARATLNTLLGYGAIPIVNENDTVATDEIRYGDNDRLAARVAQLIGADLLVLLSDIEGLYDADPRSDPAARLIGDIPTIDASIHAMAGDAVSSVGTGGMKTKILAAEMAASSGCATAISLGSVEKPVLRLASKSCGSWFHPSQSTASAREQWIAGSLNPVGKICVDDGAASAVLQGKSLLPIGAISIDGKFERGDTVQITNAGGKLIARGISAYDAADARRILGRQTGEIEAILGYRRSAALVHTDDIVLV